MQLVFHWRKSKSIIIFQLIKLTRNRLGINLTKCEFFSIILKFQGNALAKFISFKSRNNSRKA